MPGKPKYKGEINFLLAKAIQKRFGSVAKMCREWPGLGGKQSVVSALIHLSFWPWNEGDNCAGNFGKLKKVCALVAEALDIFPEKLFPIELYISLVPEWQRRHIKERTRATVHASLARLDKLTAPDVADYMATTNELKQRIRIVLKTLSYREREIIKLRYGLDDGYSYTIEEVSHIFKVTQERIHQIEAKAVRKLQQQKNSQQLESFLD